MRRASFEVFCRLRRVLLCSCRVSNLTRHALPKHSSAPHRREPLAEVAIALQRTGRLAGRFVDYDTGVPLPNFYAHAVRVTGSDGRFVTAFENHLSTDSNGAFRLESASGCFRYRDTAPRAAPENGHGRGSRYRRGGLPSKLVSGHVCRYGPVTVAADADVNLGTIRIRKQRLYHVRVEPDPSFCPLGSQMGGLDSTLQVIERQTVRDVPCGRFALPARPPGDYELDLKVGKAFVEALSAPPTSRAVIRYSVTDQDVVLRVTSTAAQLRGRVKRDDGNGRLGYPSQWWNPQSEVARDGPKRSRPMEASPSKTCTDRFSRHAWRGWGFNTSSKRFAIEGRVAPEESVLFSGGGEVEIEVARSRDR